MRNRWSTVALVMLVAIAGAACGDGDEALIESYFQASNAGDIRTIEQIAAMQFEEQVDAWTKVASSPEMTSPVTLPELMKRYEGLKAEYETQREESSRYALNHFSAVEKVKTLLEQEQEVPAELQEVAEAWQGFSGRDEELKAAVAEARGVMQNELRVCQISAGEASDLATSAGEIVSKEVELSLTIGGEAKPHVMTLRRYMLEETDIPHEISRWIIYDLKPKD